jgi:hypothetical protein
MDPIAQSVVGWPEILISGSEFESPVGHQFLSYLTNGRLLAVESMRVLTLRNFSLLKKRGYSRLFNLPLPKVVGAERSDSVSENLPWRARFTVPCYVAVKIVVKAPP